MLGYNLYAYCSNNPINYFDEDGCGKLWDRFKVAVKSIGSTMKNAFFEDMSNLSNAAYAFFIEDFVNAYKNPTPGNIAWAALTFIPEGKITKLAKVEKLFKLTKTGERIYNVSKSESKIWKSFNNVKNSVLKTTGTGKNKRYYKWDYTHNDIEVFDHLGNHVGSMDPVTGTIYKGKVIGRNIKKEI
ncbi:MAG: colicin E3/pyocin S6 family cytotoxin [Oscillospiraceae bacterium]|nr:colicin E3/pyocin S6 family cytotoxin [Oscillospiraceae bacterium]